MPSVHVPAIATVGLHDLRGVVYALAGKFGDYSDVLDALNAPFAKWTDKSMPDPEVIGGYMYAWLIIRTVLIIRLTPLLIIRLCTSRDPRGTAVDNIHG